MTESSADYSTLAFARVLLKANEIKSGYEPKRRKSLASWDFPLRSTFSDATQFAEKLSITSSNSDWSMSPNFKDRSPAE